MARSTGPVLAIGAITLANNVLLNNKPFDFKVPIATGIAVGVFTLIEKASEQLAVGLAWVALLTLLLVRTNPSVPSPVESLNNWWNSSKK